MQASIGLRLTLPQRTTEPKMTMKMKSSVLALILAYSSVSEAAFAPAATAAKKSCWGKRTSTSATTELAAEIRPPTEKSESEYKLLHPTLF